MGGRARPCSSYQPSTAAQVHQAQLLRPSTWAGARRDGLVAVKIQYPDALTRMLQDLVNIRVAARFLQVGTCLPGQHSICGASARTWSPSASPRASCRCAPVYSVSGVLAEQEF